MSAEMTDVSMFSNTDNTLMSAAVAYTDNSEYFSGEDTIVTSTPQPVNGQANPRRSTRPNKGIPPKRLIEEMCLATETNPEPNPEPKTYNEAVCGSKKAKWLEAMEEEIKSLNEIRGILLIYLKIEKLLAANGCSRIRSI